MFILKNCGTMRTLLSILSKTLPLLLVGVIVGCEREQQFDPHRKRWEPEYVSTGWHTYELAIDVDTIDSFRELPATTIVTYDKEYAWLPKRTRVNFNDDRIHGEVLETVDEIIASDGDFVKLRFIEEDRECINMKDMPPRGPNDPLL